MSREGWGERVLVDTRPAASEEGRESDHHHEWKQILLTDPEPIDLILSSLRIWIALTAVA